MTDNKKDDEGAPTDGKRSRVRHPVDTLAGIIKEAAIVYRAMRDDRLAHDKGRSLVWVLSQLRAMVETQALERLEARLEELSPSIEGRHGHQSANRSARTSH